MLTEREKLSGNEFKVQNNLGVFFLKQGEIPNNSTLDLDQGLVSGNFNLRHINPFGPLKRAKIRVK